MSLRLRARALTGSRSGRLAKDCRRQVADFRRGLNIGNARCVRQIRPVRSRLSPMAVQHAAGAGRGADKGQAQPAGRPLRLVDGAAVPSAGDGAAGGRDPGKIRRLSRCRLAAQASGGVGVAVGREPENVADVCAQGSTHQADDRFRRSAVQPVARHRGDKAQRGDQVRARSVVTAAYTDFWQGAGVDRTRLSQALAQLPDTADELNAIAKDLGVSATTPSRRATPAKPRSSARRSRITASSISPPMVLSPAT